MISAASAATSVFLPAHIGGSEENLAVNISQVDNVVVDKRNVSDSCRGERLHHGTSEPTGSDDQHFRAVQRFLLVGPETGKNHLAGGAAEFLLRKRNHTPFTLMD